jgi:hypothetical protein
MNEEQLKKDSEFLEEWKSDYLTTVFKTKSEPFGMVHWIDEIRAAQARVTAEEVRNQERNYWKKKLEEVLRTGLNPCARNGECGYIQGKCETHYDFVKPTGITFEDLSPNPEQDEK